MLKMRELIFGSIVLLLGANRLVIVIAILVYLFLNMIVLSIAFLVASIIIKLIN